ncbi:MAG: AbgT family transporter [Lachnospiraceae bacterium]|nr:AbgT family transporter [Lachnospiraceae bacterium]
MPEENKVEVQKKNWLDKFLDWLERVCNKLPDSIILFIYLFFIMVVLGCILGLLGVQAENPATGAVVKVLNPISTDGLRYFVGNMVSNFTGFAPLGLVITMSLAIGLCEEGGLITSLLNDKLRNVAPSILPYVIAFVGTCGNIASDTAMVVIPPIAAVLYLGAGKNPLVGIINGYAGAQAGFSANLMIAGTDSLLQGVTNTNLKSFLEGTSAAGYQVDVTCNWFFMIASTFLCGAVIGAVCEFIVEKRFGKYNPPEELKDELPQLREVTAKEKKGLRVAGIAVLVYLAIIVALFFLGPLGKEVSIPEGKTAADVMAANAKVKAIFGNQKYLYTTEFVGSVLLKNLIPVLFLLFVVAGLAYAFTAGTFKKSKDVSKAMTHQMQLMGSYVAFCFFAGQFTGMFNYTKLGTCMAIAGARGLKAAGFTGFGLIVAVILMTGIINLFVPSGSAKWTILAPVFVPMLMLLNYHPGFIQLIYRLGDSPTNAFTPLSPYLWVQLSLIHRKYDPDAGIGTLASGLFPIGIILQIAWIIFLAIWMLIGLNIGPGVGVHLPAELAAALGL